MSRDPTENEIVEIRTRAVETLSEFLDRLRSQGFEVEQLGNIIDGWHPIPGQRFFTPQVRLLVDGLEGWATFQLHKEWKLSNSFRVEVVRRRRGREGDKKSLIF